ncbi:MAG: ornithine carbamoyltransferase [Candidatus Makana argininalis]
MNSLFKRNFLRLIDFSENEIKNILLLSHYLKKCKKLGTEIKYLNGKNILLIFEKPSTRTRCSFEVSAFDQGANITYIDQNTSQMHKKESVKDTSIVLGKMYDAIQYRGYNQNYIENIAKYSKIPVWNGLTNEFHPTQLIADLLTIEENIKYKPFNKINLTYIGDASNNIGNSLLEASAVTGLNLTLVSPKYYFPNKKLINYCTLLSKNKGGNINITEDILNGVKASDFIYTDVWLSMGDNKSQWKKKIKNLRNYQLNSDIINLIDNKNVKFLHCLPSFHNNNSDIGKKISKKYGFKNGIEVTNDVFESEYSLVFKQAENRLHTIKAIMIYTLNKNVNIKII